MRIKSTTTLRFATVLAAGLLLGVLGSSRPAAAQEQPPPETEACIQEKQEILAHIDRLASRRQRGCRSDDQCGLISLEISCQPGCPGAVLAGQAGAFREELTAFDREVCPRVDTSCGIAPACAAVERAVCVEGFCRPQLGREKPRG